MRDKTARSRSSDAATPISINCLFIQFCFDLICVEQDGKLLGGGLPADFEEKITEMIAKNIQEDNNQVE